MTPTINLALTRFRQTIDINEIAALEQRLYDLENIVRLMQEVAAERAAFEGGEQ
jgi:hypothetical protein